MTAVDPATITSIKEALLGIKEIIALVTLCWLLVYTYARVIPQHLANLSTPIVQAMQALGAEMKDLRSSLIEALTKAAK